MGIHFSTLLTFSVTLHLNWVQSHLEDHPELISSPNFIIDNYLGNRAADVFANRAATMCELSPDTVKPIMEKCKLVLDIQK